jgi:ABC-type antimicrobial peptide transport system permease subunit
MFKNYFITALRNIRRNPSFTFLNVFGLSLSMASCLVIYLVVRYELGFDNFNRKADRTYRVTLNALDFNSNISLAVVPAIRNDFPELEQVTQVFYQQDGMVQAGQSRFNEKRFAFADEYFPKVFDLQWIAGNPGTSLSEPNSVILTESTARKYFGEKKALGQVIKLNNEYTLKVNGLIKDPPGNTSLPFIFLVSLKTMKMDEGMMSQFYAIPGGSFAFIVIPQHYSIRQMEMKIPSFIEKNWGKNIAQEAKLPLQPLTNIHFDQRYINNIITPTSRVTYWALAVIGLFIILMASINFINLSTAQAIRRAREVGVRKVLGAVRTQLILQFLGETSFLVLVSLILSLAASALFLPLVSKWLDIKISASQLGQLAIIGLMATITILVILLAGLYPAFVQSSFRPAQSLKSKTGFSFRGFTLRKSLVFVQFAISQILIVGTLVVASQMDFLKNKDLGFNKETVVNFWIPNQAKREVLRQQLTAQPGVKEISFSSGAPSMGANATGFSAPALGITKIDVTQLIFIDEKYTDMFGLKMLAGEKIGKKNEKDSNIKLVINETLMHKLGIQDPHEAIGKEINLGPITGVVQDFQSESKHKKRRSCVLMYRVVPGGIHKTMDQIDNIWSGLFPENIFEFEFLDEHIANMYRQEEKLYIAFKLFSSLAILIGCLGLYGLVAFAAIQRTKEVGIRKVLGASLLDIITLFAKEFFLLIAIAFLIAAPVAYLSMHNWLENFAYQVSVGKGIFLISIGASFLIAAITISFQAVKAALTNPVKSLRTE